MRRKTAVLAVLAGAALALAVFLFVRHRRPAEPEPFPPGALAGYLPPDSTAVLTLNPRLLFDAPLFQGRLRPALQRLVRRGISGEPWMGLAGIDAFTDLDQLQISFAAGDPEHPLWLVRGRFHPERFGVGPDKLRPRVEDGRRIYEYTDPDFGPTLLAPVGDTLVVSAAPRRLAETLAYAAKPHPVPLRYPVLAAALEQVDQKQPVWLAASLADFGSVGRMGWALELVLRPVLSRTRSVHGGLRVAEDLRAEFTFRAGNAEGARQLEEVLQREVDVAAGTVLVPGIDRDWLPFFQLLGSGKTTRNDTTVSLRCRLTAEQLQP